jgi:hypothetical protein
MAFPDELLRLAEHLRDIAPPDQATLRRAVSTAYYALFHLLISEATSNWARPELRALLARSFDHGPMKSASEARVAQINVALKENPLEAQHAVLIHLRTVASVFTQAQQRRNDADYNMTRDWTLVEAEQQIASVKEAFESWRTIRDEAVAQAYLVSLLGSRDRRASESKSVGAKIGEHLQ